MADPVFKLASQNASAAGDKPLCDRHGVNDGGAQFGAKEFGAKELEACLENRHFRVEYQPKVALHGNQTSQFGVEALCRIRDPGFGTVSPDKFIAIAEASGLIAKLTDAVVCDAFRAWHLWDDSGLSIRLALNVSPLLLGDRQWAHAFLQRCAEFKMNPKWVTLEITETAAGATGDHAGRILGELHDRGFKLSIDDFGTGFSSLATLYRLPISEMKIDKGFVLEMDKNPGAREVVVSAVAMAKRLGIKVVAEGVETERVFEELRRIGCDEIQGFFVGKSLPVDAVVPFFTDWNKARPSAGAPGSGTLPKIVIMQALLNDLANDIAPPVMRAQPYGAMAVPAIADDHTKDLLLKIPPLVLAGKTIVALAACHEAVRALDKTPGGHAPRSRIGQLQAQLEGELLSRCDLEIGTQSHGTYRLLPRQSVTLGRASSVSSTDIAIECRWFNPGDKNLRIFWENGQHFLEDLGSRHGHLVDGARLDAQRPFPIPPGKTSVELRLASGGQAPVSLLLQRRFHDPDAVLVNFEYDEQVLLADLGGKDWLTLKGQLEQTWIVFSGKVSLGRSSECSIVLRDCVAPVAAAITFDNGYWTIPADGSALRVGDTPFRQRLPLVLDCELDLDGQIVTARDVREAGAAAAQAPKRAARLSAG